MTIKHPATRANNLPALAFALLAAAILSACGAKPQVKPDAPPPTEVPVTHDDSVSTVVHADGDDLAGLSAEVRSALEALQREGMIVYFDYDSSRISSEALALLTSHARFASRFSRLAIRLEGHTDERGSREYNEGLGERRAQAVKQALALQGITEGRMLTVSYGEERPAEMGSGESAWSKNRRVELRYSR